MPVVRKHRRTKKHVIDDTDETIQKKALDRAEKEITKTFPSRSIVLEDELDYAGSNRFLLVSGIPNEQQQSNALLIKFRGAVVEPDKHYIESIIDSDPDKVNVSTVKLGCWFAFPPKQWMIDHFERYEQWLYNVIRKNAIQQRKQSILFEERKQSFMEGAELPIGQPVIQAEQKVVETEPRIVVGKKDTTLCMEKDTVRIANQEYVILSMIVPDNNKLFDDSVLLKAYGVVNDRAVAIEKCKELAEKHPDYDTFVVPLYEWTGVPLKAIEEHQSNKKADEFFTAYKQTHDQSAENIKKVDDYVNKPTVVVSKEDEDTETMWNELMKR